MLKKIKWILMAVGLIVLIFAVIELKDSIFPEDKPPAVPISDILIREQIKDIAELATLELQFADFQEYHWIDKKGFGYTNHKHALLVAAVKVKIGFNLSRSRVELDSAAKKISMTLPEPEVLTADFIKKNVYDELPLASKDDTPLFDSVEPLKPSEADSLFNKIKVQAIDKALSAENIAKAKKNGAFVLSGLFRSMSEHQNYRIDINFFTVLHDSLEQAEKPDSSD